jgi:hypothetical protein
VVDWDRAAKGVFDQPKSALVSALECVDPADKASPARRR